MTCEKLNEIITYAKSVHISLREQVDFTVQNKKHAIYLLQGGALTTVSTAMLFNIKGYLVPRAQQKRMIDEIRNLITFFDEIDENARQIKAWFKGHVIEREPGNTGNLTIAERSERYFFTPEIVEKIDTLNLQINNMMSKYMHPTIHAMRANVFRRSHLFDYDHLYTASHSMSAVDFGNLYVVPAIHALLIPVKALMLTRDQFELLRVFDKEIQSL